MTDVAQSTEVRQMLAAQPTSVTCTLRRAPSNSGTPGHSNRQGRVHVHTKVGSSGGNHGGGSTTDSTSSQGALLSQQLRRGRPSGGPVGTPSSTPIIFYMLAKNGSGAWAPYTRFALEFSRRLYHRVILISNDASCRAMAMRARAAFVDIGTLHQESSLVADFLAAFPRTLATYEYEQINHLRWLHLAAYVQQTGVHSAVYCDTDVLLNADLVPPLLSAMAAEGKSQAP
jgi:hypothetical protein